MSNLIANRYRLIKSLGKGGMGEVFLAHDSVLDRKVAIKFLSRDLTQKKEFLQRFIREARITASLDHFNIVKVYDLLILDNQYFLVMEYIEGYPLREFIEKGKNKDLNLSLEIFLQILDGMEYAHNKGVVHRDLKPENIMLTKDNIAKITDFGIAFALGSHSITNPGVLMGTLAYLSPEQAQGINVDQQTDIYSLGVILYELLTSNLPIVAMNPASMIYKILNENPLPPTKYNPNIPAQIEKIILKCLEKDKKLRYRNISQIKKDFEAYFLMSDRENASAQEITEKLENIKKNIKESINEFAQKTIGEIISEISTYRKNIQDIFYKNPKGHQTDYQEEKSISGKLDQINILEEISGLEEVKSRDLNKSETYKPFSSTDIETYLSKAQKEYENKNYQETIKILELILPYYKSKNILYVLAKSYHKLGDFQKSLYYIDLYKRDYGESEKILLLEGDVLYNLRDFANSYVSYYKVYEITGDRFYLLLASKSAVNYQPEIAIEHLSSIIPFEKDQHILLKSYKYIGLAYYKMGNYDLAIQNWENYLKYYSDKDLMPALIKSYKMAGKNLELAKIYSSLIQYTEDQNVLKEALSFYLSTGKYKEAIEVCYKLLSLNPDDLSVYQDLYLASKAISNTPSLILAIENILKLHAELSLEAKVELMEELIFLYQEEQQYWDAINIINQLIKIVGKKLEYSYQLADLLSKVEKYEEAINIIYELISIDSSNALFYEKLGEIYHKSGQLELAIQNIQTAISIDPTNYKYYKTLSNLYLESGRIQELVVILKNLIEYNPDELEAYILLSQVYLSLKNYSEAYEYILMAYSRASSREMEIPLKVFDIMLYAMAGVFKESQLINKFKEIAFEIKDPRYIPYLYLSISFFYWNKGFEINSLEYLNNLLMISKNLDKTIYILANSMISYIKGKKKEAIYYLEENQRIFKDVDIQIKKKYYEILIKFYLLMNEYSENLESYFKTLFEISDKYEVFHLVLKALFMERLAKNKADYLNALFLYEKAINEGFKDPHIVFRAFFIHFVFGNIEKAKEYIKYLIEANTNDPVYLYYYKKLLG